MKENFTFVCNIVVAFFYWFKLHATQNIHKKHSNLSNCPKTSPNFIFFFKKRAHRRFLLEKLWLSLSETVLTTPGSAIILPTTYTRYLLHAWRQDCSHYWFLRIIWLIDVHLSKSLQIIRGPTYLQIMVSWAKFWLFAGLIIWYGLH